MTQQLHPAPHSGDEPSCRIRLDIAYDGTNFKGWAKQQPTGADKQPVRTVQQTLEEALSLVLQYPIRLTVAGRTDAGVHATGQVAHCDVPASRLAVRSLDNDPANLVRRLARLLPADVTVTQAAAVPESLDARFSALARHYSYRVTTGTVPPLPTRRVTTAHWPKKVDLSAMRRAARPLLGLHDFAAFSKYREGATTVRHLTRFDVIDISTAAEPATLEINVSADAFTWSMVRSLVGAILSVGCGRREENFMADCLTLRVRSPHVPVAPACGLTLMGVDYPDVSQLAARAQQTRAVRTLPGEEHRAVGKGCPDNNPYFQGGN